MKAIWKYQLPNDGVSVDVQVGARIIHAGLDPRRAPSIWCEVETTAGQETIDVYVVGTGHPIPPGLCHRGSFVDGPFVWHVYSK